MSVWYSIFGIRLWNIFAIIWALEFGGFAFFFRVSHSCLFLGRDILLDMAHTGFLLLNRVRSMFWPDITSLGLNLMKVLVRGLENVVQVSVVAIRASVVAIRDQLSCGSWGRFVADSFDVISGRMLWLLPPGASWDPRKRAQPWTGQGAGPWPQFTRLSSRIWFTPQRL